MALPKYTAIDEPLLCLIYLQGGSEFQMKSDDTYEPLADFFNLSSEDRTLGRYFKDNRFEYKWHNMVQYARWRLTKDHYLDGNAPRGIWKLSKEGITTARRMADKYPALNSSKETSVTAEAHSLPDVDISVTEGRKKLVTHLRRERNPKVVRAKKRQALKETGKLECEVCGFDFEKVYGTIGKDFCEAHHKRPIGAAEHEVETRIEDLAIICSNCHRMIHKTKPMMGINEFRAVLKAKV